MCFLNVKDLLQIHISCKKFNNVYVTSDEGKTSLHMAMAKFVGGTNAENMVHVVDAIKNAIL